MSKVDDKQLPDLTPILDDLYIGNLAAAQQLKDHTELGITHVLSVCPEFPEAEDAHAGTTSVEDAPCPSVEHPLHCCISIHDSEHEDILSHLPRAISFIKNAIGSGRMVQDDKQDGEGPSRKHRVLVHCVMGISRSSTIVCAYLMVTRHLSLSAALMFIRRRRPLVHPNYGFRRQLALFAEQDYFQNWTQPIRLHPAVTAWQKRKKRDVARYLARVGDIVELQADSFRDCRLSLTEDFPQDSLEAASLLNEAEVTHFLSISPTSMPPLPPSRPSPSPSPEKYERVRPRLPAALSMTPTTSADLSESVVSSPMSSRSSSFSCNTRFFSPLSPPSTAATSVHSLISSTEQSKARHDTSSSESDDDDAEPTFLATSGAQHYHLSVTGTTSIDMLVKLHEAACFIQGCLNDESNSFENRPAPDIPCLPKTFANNTPRIKNHVLIHCTKESRSVIVACAYLMQAGDLRPSQAYSIVEKALPLFNPTKSFLKQLEVFHDCQYNPTRDHPLVRAATSTEGASKPICAHPSIMKLKSEECETMEEEDQFDTDADTDGHILRRALGTPMRSGSFSTNYALTPAQSRKPSMSQHSGLDITRRMSNSGAPASVRRGSGLPGMKGAEVEKLLHRCEGVGDPGFAFDVEAFRGALREIAESRRTST